MKMNKLRISLIIFTVFSSVLFLLSFCSQKDNAPKPVQSALLNPSYKNSIQTIIIQTPESLLTMRKENDVWLCEKQGIFTFADKKTVNNLIANLTKIRSMYKISDTIEAKIDLNLTEDSASIITVIDDSGKPAAKIYFGDSDTLTARINLRSEKSRICWETADDFSPYLKTDLDFWTIPEIFFAIKEPVNLKISDANLHTLLSLRHGKIYPSTQLPSGVQKERTFELKGPLNTKQIVEFYSLNTPEGKDYFYIQHINDEEFMNNAIYELSGWTYNRLTALLP